MATNDKYQEIIKRIFKGNVGKQMALLRRKIEVMEFLSYCKENNIIPNTKQQEYINKVNEEYNLYNEKVRNYLGEPNIYELEEETEEIEKSNN